MAMRACRSRRWKSGSMPPSFWDSSQTRLWMPATGFQWNFTSEVEPSAATRRNVWTPKPSIVANERGMARSDIDPHQHVGRLGLEADEVPERVVGRLRLGDLPIRLGLHRVDQVGELDPVLDEEDRDVVADQVEVALVGVELRREAPDVTSGVGRPARAGDGREPDEHRRRRRRCAGTPRRTGPSSPSVASNVPWAPAPRAWTDPLGDALVVEVHDLLAQVEVLEQGRPPLPDLSASCRRRRPGGPARWSAGRPTGPTTAALRRQQATRAARPAPYRPHDGPRRRRPHRPWSPVPSTPAEAAPTHSSPPDGSGMSHRTPPRWWPGSWTGGGWTSSSRSAFGAPPGGWCWPDPGGQQRR